MNPPAPLLDAEARPLRDLRISVTDRCNLRCTYCMPRHVFGKDFRFLPRDALLDFEEITRLARLSISLGVKKIRLSGGEPLLRHGVEKLITMLSTLHTPEGKPVEIAMTTNGLLLASQAKILKEAGLQRITVSLDAINDTVYSRITDSQKNLSHVLDGIAAAQEAGLGPVKVNTVIRRGVNTDEILPLVDHFRHTGVILRFIEFMDVGNTNGWRLDEVVTATEILAIIHAQFPLVPQAANYLGEVAKRWVLQDGSAEIGVIASVTQAFCQDCNRLRLSTDGKFYACLFAESGLDIRSPLRQGVSDEEIRARLRGFWQQRRDRYSEHRLAHTDYPRQKIEMSYIGG